MYGRSRRLLDGGYFLETGLMFLRFVLPFLERVASGWVDRSNCLYTYQRPGDLFEHGAVVNSSVV